MVYLRLARWSKAGVIERVLARLQAEQIVAIRIAAVGLDSTSIKVYPDGTGARKKRAVERFSAARDDRHCCSGGL